MKLRSTKNIKPKRIETQKDEASALVAEVQTAKQVQPIIHIQTQLLVCHRRSRRHPLPRDPWQSIFRCRACYFLPRRCATCFENPLVPLTTIVCCRGPHPDIHFKIPTPTFSWIPPWLKIRGGGPLDIAASSSTFDLIPGSPQRTSSLFCPPGFVWNITPAGDLPFTEVSIPPQRTLAAY